MKKPRFNVGLLIASPPFSANRTKDTRPITKQPQAATQAILPEIQSIPGKTPHPLIKFVKKCKGHLAALVGLLWLWLLARFYTNEKRRRIPGWTLDDLVLLNAIKDNNTRLWHHHHSPKNIIRLEY